MGNKEDRMDRRYLDCLPIAVLRVVVQLACSIQRRCGAPVANLYKGFHVESSRNAFYSPFEREENAKDMVLKTKRPAVLRQP